jgi:hypothetical protein
MIFVLKIATNDCTDPQITQITQMVLKTNQKPQNTNQKLATDSSTDCADRSDQKLETKLPETRNQKIVKKLKRV